MKAACEKSPANKLSAMMKGDNGPSQSSRRSRKSTVKKDNSECAPPTKRSRQTPKEKDDDKAGVEHEQNTTSTHTRSSRACRAKKDENKLTNGDIAPSNNQDQNNNLDNKKGSKKSKTIKRESGEGCESNDKSKRKQTISKSPPSLLAAPTTTGRAKRRSASKVKSYKESQSSDRDEKEDSDSEPKVKRKPSANTESSKSNKGSESSPDVGKPVTGKKKAPRKPTVKKRGTPKTVVKVEDVTKAHSMEASDIPKTKRDENTPTTSQIVEIKMEADKPAIDTKAVMDDGSSSDDSGDDWEEVADLPDNSPVKKDVQITMDAPADKKKKKGFDWAAYARRLWKRHQKKQHECTHQIELMGLLSHGQLVNDTCNDDLLKGFAMSLCGKTNLKGKQCNIGNIQKVVKILKQRISVESQPTEIQYLDTQTILDQLESELQSGTLSRSDHFVVLLIAVLRALGAAVRLCTAWYPIPWRISHYQKQIRQEKFKSNKGESGSPEDDKPKNKSKSKGKESPDSGRKRVPPERPFGRKIVVPDLDKQMWLEVYITSDQTWLTVDSNGDIITDMKTIEENLRRPVTYIMSYDNGGKVKDVTQKYDSSWMTGTMKLRVSSEWWEEMLAPYHVKESKKTKQEDEKIKSQQEQMPFPNTIGGFKDHPLYALERHILKFQGIYPSTAVPLGYTKTKEPIYSRSCVHTLHSRETWLKEALQIKIGEEAYKFVKPRPKMSDIKNGIKITEATLPVYGLWQTEKYVPPTAENGKVPRNGYGNVELFKPEMLPGGCVHLPHNSIGRLARRMDIDCAQAMIGWDSHSGCSVPMFDGWVVCEEHEDTLMGALEEYEAEMAKKEQDKLEKRIYGNWKKLIKGLLIRERLRNRYGKDNF